MKGYFSCFWVLFLSLLGLELIFGVQFSSSEFETFNTNSFRLNQYIGPQDLKFSIIGKLWKASSSERIPSIYDLNCSKMNNSVVVYENTGPYIWYWSDELRLLESFQSCGAVAAIKSVGCDSCTYSSQVLGIAYHMRDSDCCMNSRNTIKIPALIAWSNDFSIALQAAEDNLVNVTITSVEESDWEKLFQSSAFVAFFRIILTLINIGILGIALHALVIHQRSKKSKGKKSSSSQNSQWLRTIFLIQSVIGLNILGCLIRIFYCALGPVFSTPIFNLYLHIYLGMPGISLTLQLFSIGLTVYVFRRWSSVKKAKGKTTMPKWKQYMQFEYYMPFTCCFIAIIVNISTFLLVDSRNSMALFFGSPCLSMICIVSSFVIFFLNARQFKKKLQGTETQRLQRRQSEEWTGKKTALDKGKIRAKQIIRLCNSAQLWQLFIVILTLIPPVLLHPIGWSFLWFCLQFGFSLSGLFGVMVFTPRNALVPAWLVKKLGWGAGRSITKKPGSDPDAMSSFYAAAAKTPPPAQIIPPKLKRDDTDEKMMESFSFNNGSEEKRSEKVNNGNSNQSKNNGRSRISVPPSTSPNQSPNFEQKNKLDVPNNNTTTATTATTATIATTTTTTAAAATTTATANSHVEGNVTKVDGGEIIQSSPSSSPISQTTNLNNGNNLNENGVDVTSSPSANSELNPGLQRAASKPFGSTEYPKKSSLKSKRPIMTSALLADPTQTPSPVLIISRTASMPKQVPIPAGTGTTTGTGVTATATSTTTNGGSSSNHPNVLIAQSSHSSVEPRLPTPKLIASRVLPPNSKNIIESRSSYDPSQRPHLLGQRSKSGFARIGGSGGNGSDDIQSSSSEQQQQQQYQHGKRGLPRFGSENGGSLVTISALLSTEANTLSSEQPTSGSTSPRSTNSKSYPYILPRSLSPQSLSVHTTPTLQIPPQNQTNQNKVQSNKNRSQVIPEVSHYSNYPPINSNNNSNGIRVARSPPGPPPGYPESPTNNSEIVFNSQNYSKLPSSQVLPTNPPAPPPGSPPSSVSSSPSGSPVIQRTFSPKFLHPGPPGPPPGTPPGSPPSSPTLTQIVIPTSIMPPGPPPGPPPGSPPGSPSESPKLPIVNFVDNKQLPGAPPPPGSPPPSP